MSKPYKCDKCGGWYIKQDGLTGHCAVLHKEGECCHYSEIQVDDPNRPKIIEITQKEMEKIGIEIKNGAQSGKIERLRDGSKLCWTVDFWIERDPSKQTKGADGFKEYING